MTVSPAAGGNPHFRRRRRELAGVTAPALVIHGDRDVLVRSVGGRATAKAIPTARLIRYPGMGHDLPRALWPTFADEIACIAEIVPPQDTAPGRLRSGEMATVNDRAVSPGEQTEGAAHAG